MGPTIHDVAKLANTSKSTVSRFLNGRKVKKTTEEALEKAIRELNYHRNANARRLVTDKTNTIAVVIDDLSNIFYSGIIRGIESVMASNGFRCIFLSSTSSAAESERSFLNLLYEGQADGLILASFRKRDPADVEAFRASPYPVALIGDYGEADGLLAVDVDNAAGVADVVRHLYDLGHRAIAYITGRESMGASRYRYKGYRRSLEALGLPFRAEWVVEADWTNRGGYEAMRRLLRYPEITAVAASSDETAIGALRAVHESGKRVPHELSIVGFDDISIASWVYPPLTTVRQPFRDIGALAAEGLLRRIEGAGEPPRARLLKPALVVRDSSGAPAAARNG